MTKNVMMKASLDDLKRMRERGKLYHNPDAPEGEDFNSEFWAEAEVVLPVEKKSVHLRVDSDVLDFFKSDGRGHLTRMNAVLRRYMEAQKTNKR